MRETCNPPAALIRGGYSQRVTNSVALVLIKILSGKKKIRSPSPFVLHSRCYQDVAVPAEYVVSWFCSSPFIAALFGRGGEGEAAMCLPGVSRCWLCKMSVLSVQDGVVSPEDCDTIMSQGLGHRYAFMGPWETGYLNAEGGYLSPQL